MKEPSKQTENPPLSLQSFPNPQEKTYWRSLEQLSQTSEFRSFLEREFPQGASELTSSLTRRSFMHFMGASLALAGLASCRRPEENILPYNQLPENMTIGVPKHYATTMVMGQTSLGLLVESHEGRPTKIEGNPSHPASGGSSNVFTQATILELYDPDRSQKPLLQGQPITEQKLLEELKQIQKHIFDSRGDKVAILSGAFTSPTLLQLRQDFLSRYPMAKWYTWEPISDDNLRAGSRIAFGKEQDFYPLLSIEKAKVIVSFDSDFLGMHPDSIRYTRAFASRRTPESSWMNRLYVVESSFSITGTCADHRLRVKPSEVGTAVVLLAKALEKIGISLGLPASWSNNFISQDFSFSEKNQTFISAMAQDLKDAKTDGVVLTVGWNQPPEIHALVCAINQALGAPVKTVHYIPSSFPQKQLDRDCIQELAQQLDGNKIETLIVFGSNPVYTAPADVDFEQKIKKAKKVIHLGMYLDESAHVAHLHVPQTHFLEAWGDAQATDGTISIIQPLIAPLYHAWSEIEFVEFLASPWEDKLPNGYNLVRKRFQLSTLPPNDMRPKDAVGLLPVSSSQFEVVWKKALKEGVWSQREFYTGMPVLQPTEISKATTFKKESQAPLIEVQFVPDYSVYDGRFANNGWLQEFPDPITKMVWDNAAIVSPKTAKHVGIHENELIQITVGTKTLEVAAHLQPGQADDTITISLGYGRSHVGRIGKGAGFNAYLIRQLDSQSFAIASSVRPTKTMYTDPRDKDFRDIVSISGLASTQDHFSMEGRPLIREGSLEEFQNDPKFAQKKVHFPPLKALWQERKMTGQQWGMSIDLSKCIGCGACTIACQAENNIPIVGKAQVRKNREMHWIRVDRYFSNDAMALGHAEYSEDPEVFHQPVPCMHCENAPCENVCPVAATMHSEDGLNDMVYNRCVGTRYCENNCPYKVRRFNFFEWRSDVEFKENDKKVPDVAKLRYNPEVTLRSRGVMEKCTYCVQRIRGAQQHAKIHGKETVEDGKITTACQQACPAGAIVFGDIHDAKSQVSNQKKNPRNYGVLEELNTKPRTTYLARIQNPNPTLKKTTPKTEAHHG